MSDIPNPLTRSGILLWGEKILFAVAFVMLGYCAFVMTDAWVFQRRARTDLERVIQERRVLPHTSAPVATGEPARHPALRTNDLIGEIAVPRLGVSVAVLEGTDTPVLRRAAGHIVGTALPGQPGNIGIAAHRDTFFRPLRNIRLGDLILVTTPEGEYRYRVTSTRIVSPDDVGVLNSDGVDSLTLVTCYPFYYVGPAPKRFIVRAEQVTEPTISRMDGSSYFPPAK